VKISCLFVRHRFLPFSARVGGPSCRDQPACMIVFHCVHILLSSAYRSSELSICISMYRPRRHRLRFGVASSSAPLVHHSFVIRRSFVRSFIRSWKLTGISWPLSGLFTTVLNSHLTMDAWVRIDGPQRSGGVGRTFSLAIVPEQPVSLFSSWLRSNHSGFESRAVIITM
jgi:hypothetical protein